MPSDNNLNKIYKILFPILIDSCKLFLNRLSFSLFLHESSFPSFQHSGDLDKFPCDGGGGSETASVIVRGRRVGGGKGRGN